MVSLQGILDITLSIKIAGFGDIKPLSVTTTDTSLHLAHCLPSFVHYSGASFSVHLLCFRNQSPIIRQTHNTMPSTRLTCSGTINAIKFWWKGTCSRHSQAAHTYSRIKGAVWWHTVIILAIQYSLQLLYSEKHWREKTLANSVIWITWRRKLWRMAYQ